MPGHRVPENEVPQLEQAKANLKAAEGAEAIATAAQQLLRIDPAAPEGWHSLAQVQSSSNKSEDALLSYSRALRIDPDNETLLGRYIDQALKAQAHLDALSAARHWASLDKERSVTAMRLLSGLYGILGKEALSCHWALNAAYQEPTDSTEATDEQHLRVLVLGTLNNVPYQYDPSSRQLSVSEGHNNLMHMTDRGAIALYSLTVDVIDDQPEVLSRIPHVDVIYNSITDVGRCHEGLRKAEKVCAKFNAPVINAPSEVLRTTRAENAERLGQNECLLMPRSISLGRVQGDISGEVQRAVRDNGLKAPIIVRPSGFQNGKHMYRIDDPGSTPVRITSEAEVYVLQYHDVTFTDSRAEGHRFHPKYRAFMVDGKLYPAHLRVGHDGDWNVHWEETRKAFRKFPWLYDMEQDYIEDPVSHFEAGIWEDLEAALKTLDLDYFGVDFAVCTEAGNHGRIVVFEANASMRSFLRQTYQNTPENEAAREIILAAHRMFCARGGVPEWDFNPPKGLEGPAQKHGLELDPAVPVARHVLFSGDLQGHGFREWLRHELHTHNLKGWLRNLSDGRVEAVLAGSDKALAHLLSDPNGPEEASIDQVAVADWTGTMPRRIRVLEAASEPAGTTAVMAEA
ncbi:acylphosphatase [Salicola sp. Rm-C-2C1-2]|uniref:acylphosphatase n=1 Tax=Salicola sp. Rm-C-2C1-2 TaxID=3141321 RepID=UPI0032E37706